MSGDLIAKLVAAKCGSRELDREIAEDVLGYIVEPEVMSASPTLLVRFLVIPKVKAGVFELPHFTTSVDAALTLVPKGWSVAGIWQHENTEKRPWWGCELRRDDPNYRLNRWLGKGAKTAALAVCLEALRARA